MSDRLSAADVAFLYLEGRTTPQHVGGLAILDTPSGFDYDRLVRLIEERISLAPHYRQRLRRVPGSLANPVWVDDVDFDITYHVRRSALPRPGNDDALLEFCGRILSRLLDRDRPLWEMYLVEGLSGGRIGIVTKTHPSMVDGVGGIDITEVLLDESPQPRRTVGHVWVPEPPPSSVRLIADALAGSIQRPAVLADTVRLSMQQARSRTGWLTTTAQGLSAAVGSALTRNSRQPRHSPLRADLGRHRRIVVARTDLEDYRRIRAGRRGTVNDAILTVVAGVLRHWLTGRGEVLGPAATVRALVPVGMRGSVDGSSGSSGFGVPEDGDPAGGVAGPGGWAGGGEIAALLVDLPIGEPDPLRRLARVQYAMAAHSASGMTVGAGALVGLSGFAPPTLHSLGARAANGLTRRMYDIAITNVPGPQQPLYAAGAELTEIFPILPLTEGHALSVGVTSYNGGVFFGINADRDAVPNVAELADLVPAALAELVSVSRPADIEPGRTRRRPPRETRT